jgi:CubicO group peptidase (beta-lactamase class C family)
MMDGDILIGEAAGGFSAEGLSRIAPMLQSVVDQGLMGGAVTLIWRRGALAHLAAVGWRDIASGAPMTRDALFRIASMTKPVISLAAMMLVEEGKLRLDDPIGRWLPELSGMQVLKDPGGPLDETYPAAREITVEDLLTHRSGLAAGFSARGPLARAYAERLGTPLTRPMDPDAWLKALGELPLFRPPGERFQYGLSTDALGFLIARIEGQTLGELIRRRIFEPLGMADTWFWPPPAVQGRMAHMYRIPPEPGPLLDVSFAVPDEAPPFQSGSGGLISTAEDYLKFARLLLGRGEADGVRIVRPETVELMRANRLTPRQRTFPFLGQADWWATQGFGLGLATVLDAERHAGGAASPGAFGWPGAFGTWWMADPMEEMVLIFLVQDSVALGPGAASRLVATDTPGPRQAQLAFQQMVYAALAP